MHLAIFASALVEAASVRSGGQSSSNGHKIKSAAFASAVGRHGLENFEGSLESVNNVKLDVILRHEVSRGASRAPMKVKTPPELLAEYVDIDYIPPMRPKHHDDPRKEFLIPSQGQIDRKNMKNVAPPSEPFDQELDWSGIQLPDQVRVQGEPSFPSVENVFGQYESDQAQQPVDDPSASHFDGRKIPPILIFTDKEDFINFYVSDEDHGSGDQRGRKFLELHENVWHTINRVDEGGRKDVRFYTDKDCNHLFDELNDMQGGQEIEILKERVLFLKHMFNLERTLFDFE
jgi:hypothetical protein